jgi:hypothetical protein
MQTIHRAVREVARRPRRCRRHTAWCNSRRGGAALGPNRLPCGRSGHRRSGTRRRLVRAGAMGQRRARTHEAQYMSGLHCPSRWDNPVLRSSPLRFLAERLSIR